MNRLPSQKSVTPVFGLVAWLEQTKVTLPLKGVECRFDVTAGVASVEVDQIFHQNSARPLDCTYTFPLPAGAAVYRCEMHVNGRLIRAKVEEQEKARRIYREQKAAGRRAALVETERENLFTLSLGNVQPGDVIVIRFAYFQLLERLADSLSVRIPVCPGVRYIPGKPLLRSLSGRGASDDTDEVPDASRISPPRIDALDPDAACFAVAGHIASSDVVAGSLSSPSHPVLVREDSDALEIVLTENGAVPDRDFVVRWTEPKDAALEPRGWSFRSGKESFALVQLRAPVDVPVAASFPQDVYFLVDRSGSMAGAKWEKTCEALHAFVDLLGDEDRVWITLFESSFQDFAEKPLPVGQLRTDGGFRKLVLHGTAGGTELRPAAKHVLEEIARHSNDRRTIVVLITDGQVGNERDIVNLFCARPQLTVFTFGIDTVVNDAFLRNLAPQTGGECWLQTPNDDISGTIAKLADRLRRPVLTDLRLTEKWEAPTPRLPDVFGGQIIDLSLRLGGDAPATIELQGALADGAMHTFRLPLLPVDNAAIKLLWARERIATLLAQGDSAGALTLAKTHNLICEGAAFIAWDDAEQVIVAQEEIYQPSLDPERYSFARCMNFDCQVDAMEMASALRLTAAPERVQEPLFEIRERLRRKVDSQPPNWRERMLRARLDERFIEDLLHWLHAGVAGEEARREALEHFVADLAGRACESREIIRRCREFIDQHLQVNRVLYEQAVRHLDAWEAQPAV